MDRGASQSRIELRRLTVPDVVAIAAILSLSLALIARAALVSDAFSTRSSEASIYHDGRLIERVSLKPDREMTLEEGKMVIQIKDGKVRVLKSDCPRQVCLRVGWISHSGESITCVPFKTVIEIGSAAKTTLDAVVF
jgi:hypothetical protein